MLLGAALELVGFWAVSLSASAAVAEHYQMCAGAGPPLTFQVRQMKACWLTASVCSVACETDRVDRT